MNYEDDKRKNILIDINTISRAWDCGSSRIDILYFILYFYHNTANFDYGTGGENFQRVDYAIIDLAVLTAKIGPRHDL